MKGDIYMSVAPDDNSHFLTHLVRLNHIFFDQVFVFDVVFPLFRTSLKIGDNCPGKPYWQMYDLVS